MRHPLVAAATALLAFAGCGDDSGDPSVDTREAIPAVSRGEPFPDERCSANREAGTITFLTGFDFAAAASMVEVMVAEEAGYYDDLCLDVTIEPSFSTANYSLVAANKAQFASGGSFSEVVSFAAANDADFIVTEVFGPTPIDSLIVKPGEASTLDDLRGSTIGVKGKLPPSIEAMLAEAGLQQGGDYETVQLDGFDPTAHIAIGEIVGFPGWKSNEPGALDRAGIEYELFDPADSDIAGSFGVVYTNQDFLGEHPSAVDDFVRASLRGMVDAIADPQHAADIAVQRINRGGNPNRLSPDGERFRWTTESALIGDAIPEGETLGTPLPDGLQAELDQNAGLGMFDDDAVPEATTFLTELDLYVDDGDLIWPEETG